MKNVLKIFIMVFLIAALLAGCSGGIGQKGKAGVSVEEAQKNIESLISSSEYVTGNRENGEQYYGLRSDLFKEYDLKVGIKLDSETLVSYPVPFAILRTYKWKFVDEGLSGLILKPGASTNVKCEKDGKEFTAFLTNTTENEIKCSDGVVTRVKFDLYSKEDNFKKQLKSALDFTFGKNINGSTNMKDVIKEIGKPSDISYSSESDKCTLITVTYQNPSEGGCLSFGFTPDGAKMVSVDYSVQK